MLLSGALNGVLAYKALFKKDSRKSFKLYLILTLSSLLWAALVFIGFFFASNPIFILVLLAIIGFSFYLINKFSTKLALLICTLTLFVSIIVIIANFEEDYCWNKGEEADNTSIHTIIATKEDAMALKSFDVKEGAEIGISFRAHMLCHNTFNLSEAI